MAYCNFLRPHTALKFGETLRTPAMQAGLATRIPEEPGNPGSIDSSTRLCQSKDRQAEEGGVENRMFGLIHSALSTWSRTFLLAVSCWAVSLMVIGIALSLAFFGAPLPIFLFLFGWLLTLGLPTSLALVLVMSLWQGSSLEACLVVVASVALIFNFLCLSMVRRLTVSWWGARP